MSTMSREELLEQIPAYVLGALAEDETAIIADFIAQDAEAQKAWSDFQQIADAIPLVAVARTPSPALRASLLDRIREEPNQPSTVTIAARPSRPQKWLLPVAACVLVLVGLAVALLLMQTDSTSPQDLYRQIAALEDAQRFEIAPGVDDNVRGDLIASSDGNRAVIRVERLPQIDAQQSFQLWLADADGSVSGGLFRFTDFETNYIALPLDTLERSLYDYERITFSIEPRTGSPLIDRASGPRMFLIAILPE